VTLPFLDRVLLPLRRLRARRLNTFRHERELGVPLIVDAFVLDFPEGEAAYNGMGIDRDGAVWFAVSTKSPDTGARLFTFSGSSVQRVADFTPEPGTIPQGKVHVELVPYGDAMLGATHVGYYDPRSRDEKPAEGRYPGGIFFSAQRDGIAQLAQAPAGEGIIAMSFSNDTLFALTWPGGLFLTLDVPSRTLRNHGAVMGTSRICRSLGVEPASGAVFWSDDSGRIFRFDGEIAQVATTPRHEMWRKVVWHPEHRVFYGTLWNSATLFRFDPVALKCDEIGNLGGPPATLAFALAGDELHALINGPGVLREHDVQLASSVAYVRFDIGTGAKTTSGPLRLADGRWLTQSQSLLLDGTTRYALAWVESKRAPHRITPEYRTRGYAEEIVLVRF
jgi:hypothetical protein